MQLTKQTVSIIVPTLNEAENLPLLFERIDATLKPAHISYEVIIVDDHSTDGTLEVANSLKGRYPIRTVLKKGSRGKAYSLLEGFALARYDTVCMIDADLQYPPEAIAPMYREMRSLNVDIVITERSEQQNPLVRRLASKVFNLIFARLLFGISYDTQSGLKLFKKQVLDTMTLTPSPWSFDLEFIIRSLEQGFTITSHTIQFDKRHLGQPKISVAGAAIELARASIKLHGETSTRELRKRYKKNLDYLRMPSVFLLVSVMAISFATVLPSHSASALSLSGSTISQGISQPADLIGGLTSALGLNPPVNQTNPVTVALPTQVAPSPSTQTPASATTAVTPTLSPLSVKTSSTGTTGNPGSGVVSKPAAVIVIAPIPTASLANQLDPTPYYFDAETSSPAISPLARAAVYSLLIGFALIVLGLLSVSGTIKPMRMHLYRMGR